MANGSCHLQPLRNPPKRSHGTLGSSEDMCAHSLKIMMICLKIIMAPGIKLYLKRTRHLHKVGKYVRAMDLVDFLDTEEMRAKTGHKKRINVTTAQGG